jgi:hypothetical protein
MVFVLVLNVNINQWVIVLIAFARKMWKHMAKAMKKNQQQNEVVVDQQDLSLVLVDLESSKLKEN